MKKSIPKFSSDKEAEDFLNQDMSAFLEAENFHATSFEFLPKTEKVNLRVPALLLDAIKHRAEDQSMPYQKFIRQVLEREVLTNRH